MVVTIRLVCFEAFILMIGNQYVIPAFLLLEPGNLIKSDSGNDNDAQSEDDAATVSFKTITIRLSMGRDVSFFYCLCFGR
jgi:hypothetical protein